VRRWHRPPDLFEQVRRPLDRVQCGVRDWSSAPRAVSRSWSGTAPRVGQTGRHPRADPCSPHDDGPSDTAGGQSRRTGPTALTGSPEYRVDQRGTSREAHARARPRLAQSPAEVRHRELKGTPMKDLCALGGGVEGCQDGAGELPAGRHRDNAVCPGALPQAQGVTNGDTNGDTRRPRS